VLRAKVVMDQIILNVFFNNFECNHFAVTIMLNCSKIYYVSYYILGRFLVNID